MDDSTLLRRYVEERSETAFTELVQRHIDFVFSVALREVHGDFARARDVTQEVFIALAAKARGLRDRTTLAGWLHVSAHHAAAQLKRSEQRRQKREQEAHIMHLQSESPDAPDWEKVAPALNGMIQELNAEDREAVLLRFYRRCTFREIGTVLRLREDAVQKRVERALEKIRAGLVRRGITSTSVALAVMLETHAVVAAPVGLATTVAQGAVSATTFGGSIALVQFMSIGKLQLTALAVIVAVGVTAVTLQQQKNASLQAALTAAHNEKQQVATLRAENQVTKNELASLRAEQVDKNQRHEQVSAPTSAPRALPPVANTAPMRPIDSLHNVGNATPTAALESMIWAKEAVDLAALGKLIALTPPAREKAEAIFAGIPDEQKAKLQISNPEEMLAFFFTGIGEQISGLQILEEDSMDATTVGVQAMLPGQNGGVDQRVFVFQQSAAGWQWLFPTKEIDALPNELRKDSAKSRPNDRVLGPAH